MSMQLVQATAGLELPVSQQSPIWPSGHAVFWVALLV